MARYINDDAPVSPNLRTAKKISITDLEQIMISDYNTAPAGFNQNAVFDQNVYASQGDKDSDLMAVIAYNNLQVKIDMSNIDFDLENLSAESPTLYTYAGDQGSDLCGFHTLPNDFTFCGAVAGGDWEYPLFFIIYYDGTSLRAYIPIKGNMVNCDTLSAFGSEVNLHNPNAPYNLPQLYDLYKQHGFLTPANATLDEFIDDADIIGNSYLAQYDHLTIVAANSNPGASGQSYAGFNWDAIADELMQTIQVM